MEVPAHTGVHVISLDVARHQHQVEILDPDKIAFVLDQVHALDIKLVDILVGSPQILVGEINIKIMATSVIVEQRSEMAINE